MIRILFTIWTTIQTQNERFRYMTGNVSNIRLEETFKEHMAITEPCLKGEWEQAAEQLRYHLERSKSSSFRLVADSETVRMSQHFSM